MAHVTLQRITHAMRTDLSAPAIEQASDLAVNAARFRRAACNVATTGPAALALMPA